MILVDANILVYAAGTPHPHKQPSLRFLEGVSGGQVDAVVDAEVLQEVLHRYRAIGRWNEGRLVFDSARTLFPEVLPVTARELDGARALLDQVEGISARDALHAAVVVAHGLDGVCSYDRGFDRIPGLRRVEPDP